MKTSLYEKLLEVQKEIGAIKKEATNPFFKSKYFDINGLLAVVKPVLNAHGLILIQGLDTSHTDTPHLTTSLIEASTGEKISYSTPLPATPDAQKAGSAITYYRRYALQSLLALEAEDDDGNSSKPQVEKKGLSKEDLLPNGDMANLALDQAMNEDDFTL